MGGISLSLSNNTFILILLLVVSPAVAFYSEQAAMIARNPILHNPNTSLGKHQSTSLSTPPSQSKTVGLTPLLARFNLSSLGRLSGVSSYNQVSTVSQPTIGSPQINGQNGLTSFETNSPSGTAKFGVPLTVNTGSGFEGLHFGSNGGFSDRFVPPDVQVAVGPSHVLEMVNDLGEVWTKQGSSISTFGLSSFFATGTDFVGDPKVLFDASSGRWFASILDVTNGSIRVAASNTDDPTGSWWVYALLAPSGDCPDQPILGTSDDKVAISVNEFAAGCKSPYQGAEYWVLNKSEMIAGASTHYQYFGPYIGQFSIHPVQSQSSTSTQYFVSVGYASATSLQLLSVSGVPPNLVSVNTYTLSISQTNQPPNATQPGTTVTIKTGDNRVLDAAWQNGKLWLGLNDACEVAGDTIVRSCVRLIEIDTSGPTLLQDFDIDSIGYYYYYPALRLDAAGNLDVIFGYSTSSIYPSLAVTGQAVSDSPGTVQQPIILRLGSAADLSHRYGDYFGASVDPSNSSIVWVAGEYGSSSWGGWATYVSGMSITPSSVVLTLNYNILGGGTGYSAPTFTYMHNGAQTSIQLSPYPTKYYVDFNSYWSVDSILSGSSNTEEWLGAPPDGGQAASTQTITFLYYHLYLVTFGYQILDGGGPGISTPSVTYTEKGVQYQVGSGSNVWADAGSTIIFQNPVPGSTSLERWATDAPIQSVTTSTTYTVQYYHQFSVTVSYLTIGGDPTTSPILTSTSFGKTFIASVSGQARTYFLDNQANWNLTNPILGGNGERWIALSTLNGIVTSNLLLIPVYRHQYYLHVNLNAPNAGTLSESSGWYDSASNLTLTATPSQGWQFEEWIGTGSASSTGTSNPISLTLTGAFNETAIFYAGLTIIAPSEGTITYSYLSSTGIVKPGTSSTIYVPPGTTVTLRASPSSYPWTFSNWIGASASSQEITFKVNTPSTLGAQFGYNLFALLLIPSAIVVIIAGTILALRRKRNRLHPPATV